MKLKFKKFIILALAISFFLAIFISPFASPYPDGLERVAEDKGFIGLAEGKAAWTASPITDYVFPGVKNESVATGLAGLIGVAITFGAAYGLAKALKKTERKA